MFSSMLSLLGSLRGGSSFITNSLRFRSSASAYLSRTPSAAGNRTTWTWSGWVKRGALTSGTTYTLFDASTNSSNVSWISFRAGSTDDSIGFVQTSAGTSVARKESSNLLRDPSAWYHIVVVYNSGDTASNRIIIYINGVQVTSFAGIVVDPLLNLPSLINNNAAHNIGRSTIASQYFDGYLTEVNFIDGQALTPASFGAIDSSTGVWAPRPYSGTYGPNGFYLKFANTSSVAALGNDSSGNNNTWTVNNVSLTAGATYDSMIDVPVNYSDGGNNRGNYCTLNPLDNPNTTISASQNGNLTANLGSGSITFLTGTHSVINGKYYWEYTASTVGNGLSLGITYGATTFADVNPKSISYSFSGTKRVLGVDSAYGATYTTNDVIGVAVDSIAGTIQFFKNNVAQPVITDSSISLQEFKPCVFNISSSAASLTQCNFGQRPFQNTTAWATLQAAGFRALNTNNLPTPSIVNGANFMAAKTYTGTGNVQSILNTVNNVSFQPDLVWIKSRTPAATSHALFDSVRGTTKYLSSDTTAAETTLAQSLTAFNADGFSLGTDTTIVNANANSYIAWQWRESIAAGLDIVSYAGTGVDRTVAHNLGVAPAMIIVKRSQTGATSNWQVRHTSIPVANSIQLNLPNGAAAATTVWASTAPTSSVFTVGTSADVNASGISYVAYCFAQIAGFSRFGSYTGNGLPDGPFVFCGFRPRFVMVKNSSASTDWQVRDTSRDSYNIADHVLYPNGTFIETFADGRNIDILSNGFKVRWAGAQDNGSTNTIIFAAFAEVPSKYALAR